MAAQTESLLQLLVPPGGLACHWIFWESTENGVQQQEKAVKAAKQPKFQVCHLCSPNGVKHRGVFPQPRLERTGLQVTETMEWEDKRLENDL